jgi:hypothetical protein
MKKAKHRPGPWKAFYDNSPCAVIPGWQIKTNDRNKVFIPICVVGEPTGGTAPRDAYGRQLLTAANAELIAAAPDLKKALRNLLSSPVVAGMSARIRDEAKERGKRDPFAIAEALLNSLPPG